MTLHVDSARLVYPFVGSDKVIEDVVRLQGTKLLVCETELSVTHCDPEDYSRVLCLRLVHLKDRKGRVSAVGVPFKADDQNSLL